MPVPVITFENLSNGQDVVIPYEVAGSATVSAGSVAIMAKQIDAEDPANVPSPFFTVNLGAGDCPVVGAWYLLTMYAWDNTGDAASKSVSFRRVEPGSGGGTDTIGGGLP
jgi:hypothetical protein